MSKNMKLQFSHQDYQTRAVQAVVQVFDGQPLAKSDFSLTGLASSVEYASDGSIGNVLKLSDEALLANVQKVQKANGVAVELLSNLVYGIQAAFSVDCSSSCLPSLKMTLLTTKVNKLNP